MIVKKNKTVYICEYCQRVYIQLYWANIHEKCCRFNPINDHICFKSCQYLTKRKGDPTKKEPKFIYGCTATGNEMYCYTAIRDRNDVTGMTKMPVDCPHYIDKNAPLPVYTSG